MWDGENVGRLVDMLTKARVASDLDTAVAFFADDATFQITGLGKPASGKDALRERLRSLFNDFEFIAVRPIKAVAEGNEISIRYGLTVRHLPSGRVADTEVADFVTMRDGRCVSYVQHVDTALIMEMMQA